MHSPCSRCPSLSACRKQIVFATPCQQGGLLAIGEAPGADEDREGEGFVGRAGKTLDALLKEHGIERVGYGRANIVRCRPPENRKPTAEEVANCLPYLAQAIEVFQPAVLLLVGGTASDIVLGAGSLLRRIELSRESAFNDFSLAHTALRANLGSFLSTRGGMACVPMPHTSPLAWNRKATNGRKWAEIGREQIALAVSHLR